MTFMALPQNCDYIDIHNHGGTSSPGHFVLETLMAHEQRLPVSMNGMAYTIGIHPWYLTQENFSEHLEIVNNIAAGKEVIAIGEAGFDRLKGPDPELQRKVFCEQVSISEKLHKPMVIHCVRAWDELFLAHKKMKPAMPWIIHGFRGNIVLAEQLLAKGFNLSIWFEFALRSESSALFRQLPLARIFLETDGADVKISDIYAKVASDRAIPTDELKSAICRNFNTVFSVNQNQ